MTTARNSPLLPGMAAERGSEAIPVPAWMLKELATVGAGAEAAEALQVIAGEYRGDIHRFFLHFYSSRHSAILQTLEGLAEKIVRTWCNLPIGGISLVGHARCTVSGFALGNDFAVFYIVALGLKRPDLAPHLEHTSPMAELLVRSGWNPFARGADF